MAPKEVKITGEAMDLKAGAIVVPDEGGALFIDGLAYWPDGLSGRRVTVSGRIVQKKYVPQVTVSEDGAISQGVDDSGTDKVLEKAKWTLAE